MTAETHPSPNPLLLDGPLDIQRVIARRKDLAAPPAQPADPVILDLSEVTACDTAGLQLLCSAQRSATLNGRAWRPQHPSEAVLRACTEVGMKPEQLGL